MNKKIRKQCCGYEYTYEDEAWYVTTDYVNGKIYLSVPEGDDDLAVIKRFGIAIGKAVVDMRKDMKL